MDENSDFVGVGLQVELQSGVTFLEKWGYKSGFLGGMIQGGEDTTFLTIGTFFVSIAPP